MAAAEPKFCFKCRAETDHVPVGVIGDKTMYQCPNASSCRAAPREITPRHNLTSTPRLPAPPAKMQRPAAIRRAGPQKHTNRRIIPMPKPAMKSPLVQTIEKIVESKIGPKPLTRDEVVEIVRTELAAQLGLEAPKSKKKGAGAKKALAGESTTSCPRGEHKYACPSKKCIEAGYRADQ